MISHARITRWYFPSETQSCLWADDLYRLRAGDPAVGQLLLPLVLSKQIVIVWENVRREQDNGAVVI